MYERARRDYLDLREGKAKYYSDDQMKEDEMGGAYSTWKTELHLAHWYQNLHVNNFEDPD